MPLIKETNKKNISIFIFVGFECQISAECSFTIIIGKKQYIPFLSDIS